VRVKVEDTIGDLAKDLAAIPRKVPADCRRVVREGVRAGNMLAKGYAKDTSGTHAKLYPGTFTTQTSSFSGFGASVYSGEYGPESRGQGNLASILENGSRNNKPHLNLARSADIIGPSFAQEVRALPDKWFWSGGGSSAPSGRSLFG